ncbi:MFS transporter [Calidifontibacter sp. DB0510]|uniref:MFS transporter n=1 Tax=Metallococcus carri TaxID=1656884 RepID=A0A967E823_9MICO|nr:MFS transporter [Metallococcus carri]NHN54767.1 MFS transporter [Metallococcus carri]NOP37112.1 MFS transporter [Calidifontibacter sp. DB2511S]
MTTTTTNTAPSATFSDLFRDGHAAPVSILTGGFLLAALTMYVTTALMPSVIADIGGEKLYAWPTTIYVIASVVGVMGVSHLLAQLGPAAAYLVAFGTYLIGAAGCALAFGMPRLLASRGIVGLGGGLLSGLGYALVRTVLPAHLWGRATALISATFGFGTLVGPLLGGVFAQFGAWREAFALVALAGLGLALATRRTFAGHPPTGVRESFPVGSMVLLTAAVALLSVASLRGGTVRAALLVLATIGLVVFLGYDRRAASSVLPRSAFDRRAPLLWLLATNAFLTVAVVSEAFAPFFGQRLAGLAPIVAGLFGAAVSVGWSFLGLLGARASAAATQARLLVAGPMLLAAGLFAVALTQRAGAGPGLAAGWFVLMVLAGGGIGLAFPVLSQAVMSNVADEREAAKTAACIPLIGLIAQSVGAALAGVLVNAGLPSLPRAATNLFVGLAVLALMGAVTAVVANRRGAFAH